MSARFWIGFTPIWLGIVSGVFLGMAISRYEQKKSTAGFVESYLSYHADTMGPSTFPFSVDPDKTKVFINWNLIRKWARCEDPGVKCDSYTTWEARIMLIIREGRYQDVTSSPEISEAMPSPSRSANRSWHLFTMTYWGHTEITGDLTDEECRRALDLIPELRRYEIMMEKTVTRKECFQ